MAKDEERYRQRARTTKAYLSMHNESLPRNRATSLPSLPLTMPKPLGYTRYPCDFPGLSRATERLPPQTAGPIV